jgi:pimeloyl-ACP methyl ester carboxylesterase
MNAWLICAAAIATPLGLWFVSARITKKVEQAVPATGRMIDVPGAVLHVRDQGSGPAILLIHGLAGQMAHFTYGVAERLSGYRVVTLDRPGSGYSTRAASADLSTQAGALAALIDKLELDRPLVVGHSLGGAVALALAVEHPERVAGLALIAPLTRMPRKLPPAFAALAIRPRWLNTVFSWTVAIPATIASRKIVLRQVFSPEPVAADFARRGGDLLGLRPSAFQAASHDLQALPQRLPAIVARYGELRVAVRVLFGRDDRILSWKGNGQWLCEQVAGARLRLVDGGHMLPVTQPELTANFIRETAMDVAGMS